MKEWQKNLEYGFWVHCAKWRKPDSKDDTLYEHIYDILEKAEAIGTDNMYNACEVNYNGTKGNL